MSENKTNPSPEKNNIGCVVVVIIFCVFWGLLLSNLSGGGSSTTLRSTGSSSRSNYSNMKCDYEYLDGRVCGAKCNKYYGLCDNIIMS